MQGYIKYIKIVERRKERNLESVHSLVIAPDDPSLSVKEKKDWGIRDWSIGEEEGGN